MPTTVSGKLENLGEANVSIGTFVRFYLRGEGGNQPRVAGTALIAPTLGNVYYFDFVPNASGNISGTLWSTRDATGLLGGDIEVGGVTTAVWYGMQVFVNGKAGPETAIHAKNGATFDISNVTPITSTPVITAPTGDSTYMRLDAGNSPSTGAWTFNGAFTALNANNIIHVDGNTGRTLAQGLALCAGGGAGCTIVIDGSETFTTPIVTSLLDLTIMCLTPGDVNSNTSGVTLTYTPAGNNTDAITFNGTSRVVWWGCNLTQGNANTGTRGMVWNGVQGGEIAFAQVYNFTSRQWVLSDSASSSAEYNSCYNSHFIGNSATGGFALELIQANNGKAVNQNHFKNCAFKGGFTANAIGQAIKYTLTAATPGSMSENLFSPVDVSGNGSPLVDMTGVGTGACRNNQFTPATIEGGSGTISTNQIGWAIGPCQMVQIYTEGGLSGPGTPVTVTKTTGTYNLVQGASTGPGGVKWEVIYPSFQIDKDGNMALGNAINVIGGTPPSLNVSAGFALCSGNCVAQIGSTGFLGGLANSNLGSTGNPWNSLFFKETTAPGTAAAVDVCYGDSTAHAVKCSYNNGSFFTMPQVIANGTKALNTASITTATCDAGVAATANGTVATDTVDWSFNAAPTTANKYGSFLVVYAVPSANTVTFYTCNPSATTSTPTAMTVNFSVRRP